MSKPPFSLNIKTVDQLLSRFEKTQVLVIGDMMLDEFVWGKVSRISPEAPVPIVWVQSESTMPGGAANVANNIRALGGQVCVVGVTGTDRYGDLLIGGLTSRGIDASGLIRTDRPTTVKTRVIASHQQIVRVDRERPEALAPHVVERLLDAIRPRIEEADAIILEDYNKGVISKALLAAVIPLARKHKKIITVDPKQEHFKLYRRVTCLTPNRMEAGQAVGRELKDQKDVERAGEEIMKRLDCESLLITLGEDGLYLFEASGRRTLIPTVAQAVFDVAGAGDTVIGVYTLALACGASKLHAAQVANFAAGVVVGKVGVATLSPEELRARIQGAEKLPQASSSPRHSAKKR